MTAFVADDVFGVHFPTTTRWRPDHRQPIIAILIARVVQHLTLARGLGRHRSRGARQPRRPRQRRRAAGFAAASVDARGGALADTGVAMRWLPASQMAISPCRCCRWVFPAAVVAFCAATGLTEIRMTTDPAPLPLVAYGPDLQRIATPQFYGCSWVGVPVASLFRT
jgi:hypothetical protein